MAVGVVVVSSNKNDRLDKGEKLLVDLCDTEEQLGNMTVKELKEKINNKLLQEFPPKPGYYAGSVDEVHFKEQKLEEEDSFLSDHGIQHMSTVEVKTSSSTLERDFYGDMFDPSIDCLEMPEDKKDNRRRSKGILFDMEQPLNFSGEKGRSGSSKSCCSS